MERRCSFRIVEFGSLKALASVHVNGMEIRGFKVIDQGDGKPWVAVPSRDFTRDGRVEFYNIVRFETPKVQKEFSAWLLSEYRKALAE